MRQQKSDEERQADREALQAKLADGIDQLVTSEEWTRYLDVQKRFHRYSFGNTLLIMAQRPDATRVMPYGTRDKKTGKPLTGWLALGRHVKGPDPVTAERQHGIQIWCPSTRMVEVKDDAGNVRMRDGKPVKREQLTGWRIGRVFDVSQTDGEPLPEVTHLLSGEDDQGIYDRLVKVAGRLGFTVEDADLGAVNGRTHFGPDRIEIHPARSPMQRCKTLAHELGHAILHRDVDYGACRGVCELEAESTAYVVCGSVGLDSGGYSFGYVAGWASAGTDPGKVREMITASGQKIQKAAARIIGELDT